MKNLSLFRMNRLTPVVLFVALVASLVQVTPAYAASIVVNTSVDNYNPADGKCTLREAIDAANLNVRSGAPAGECAAGSAIGVDTISFHPGFAPYVITVGGGGTGLQQLPYIISPIVIAGLGAAITVIQAAPTPNTATWRVFQVTHLGTLTLDGVTVRNGQCPDNNLPDNPCSTDGGVEPNAGGGIYNSGILTVSNSLITGNTGRVGGGIYNNHGSVTVTNSTISNNNSRFPTSGPVVDGGGGIRNTGTLIVTDSIISGNSGGAGGGIDNSGGGTVSVTNSIFAGNDAVNGGGIFHSGSGTLTVMSSTFSGNTATLHSGGIATAINTIVTVTNSTLSGNTAVSGWGGGIGNFGNLTVTNSTIAGNTSPDSGLYSGASTKLRNTIVANNSGVNCFGTITNDGSNLDSGASCGFGAANGSRSNANPMLGPLADNGGLTQTMKLLAGSPAIDAISIGNPTCLGRDQRGVNRPVGVGCDMGAFETSAAPGPDTAGVFRPSNGLLYLKHANATGFADVAINYGLGGDYPVVGDWDGDGDDTIGVYRNGAFFLRNSNSLGFADIIASFGQPGDQPVAGDWNGDGIDTIGLYRPSTGQFFLRNTNTTGAPDVSFFLGNPGDVGIAGDWNGDGIDTTGVFRPSNGFIFLKNTNNTGFADIALNYGLAGDKPVTGDWNFDGIDTIGVLRGNIFFLRNQNTNGFADMSFALGNPGDMPIAGNWDGQP